jgi:ADP-ribose pyrophosphatase
LYEHLREEIINSEIVFRGRLLTIRLDTVRLPDGVESTREVVVHPGAVAMVPLLDAEHVLLVRQWRNAAGRALLEIPAGTLAPGEAPIACAARELMEEVGYRPRSLTPLYVTYLAPGYSSEQLHVFLADDLLPEKMAADEDERIEVVSLSWDEIDDLLLRGEFADAKTISALLLTEKLLKQRSV